MTTTASTASTASRFPSEKIMDTYKQIAKDIVDPATTFQVEKVDGRIRLITDTSKSRDTHPPAPRA